MPSPVGALLLFAEDAGLTGVYLTPHRHGPDHNVERVHATARPGPAAEVVADAAAESVALAIEFELDAALELPVTSVSSFSKSGVPKPVTASQPSTAGKPSVPQPGFEPEVMSLSAAAPCE